MAVTVKTTIFWNVIPCSLLKVSDILDGPASFIFRVEDGGSSFPENISKFLSDSSVSCPFHKASHDTRIYQWI
jgi:hypothetical protein